jgi:hypothetical protein
LPDWSELSGDVSVKMALDGLYKAVGELDEATQLTPADSCIEELSETSAADSINLILGGICELMDGVEALRGAIGTVGRC